MALVIRLPPRGPTQSSQVDYLRLTSSRWLPILSIKKKFWGHKDLDMVHDVPKGDTRMETTSLVQPPNFRSLTS